MPHVLSEEQVRFYRENGYLLVPGVFSADEIAHMGEEVDGVMLRAANQGRNLEATWGGKWRESLLAGQERFSVSSIHNLQFHSAVFASLLVDERFIGAAADLIGENVQLHHIKMHAKPPEIGSPFPLHQDYHYFPHASFSMMAGVIYLDDATDDNGCLRVVPKSHKLGPIPTEPDGLYLSPEKYPLEMSVPCEGKAGDVLFFSYLTIHGSNTNRTDHARRIVLYQLRAAEDKPIAERHVSPGQGMVLHGANLHYQ